MIVAIDTVIHYLEDDILVDSKKEILKLWAESIVEECAKVAESYAPFSEKEVLSVKNRIV